MDRELIRNKIVNDGVQYMTENACLLGLVVAALRHIL